MSQDKNNDDKRNIISIIFHQRNESPRYVEIKRSSLIFFFVSLPAIVILCLTLTTFSFVQLSPFNLINKIKQSRQQTQEENNIDKVFEEKEKIFEQNLLLKAELEQLKSQELNQVAPIAKADGDKDTTSLKCPAPVTCPPAAVSSTISSIGLSTLSLFKPIQGQKDRTKPSVLSLSGFKTVNNRDTLNFQFNIIPAASNNDKISGHIIVLMKNDIAIQAYPLQALGGNDFQINYSVGETFATQRFRPVDASFVKPRKSGNYSFTTFIFSRTGDLIHFHTVNLPVKI
jgi:hypothetical protein